MAQPTAQDLIDALDRLTKAFQTLYQLHPANSPKAQPAAGASPPAAPDAPTAPQENQKQKPLGRRLSKLAEAFRSFKSAKQAFQTFRHVRSLAKQGRWGAAFKAGRAGFGRAARGLGMAGRGAAGAAGAAGGVASAIALVPTMTVAVIEAFQKFRHHIERTTDALIQAQQKLAEVSPSMAAVMARRQMQELQRDIRKGEALSASAAELAASEQRRKDAFLPYEVFQAKVENWLYTQGNNFLAGLTEAVNQLMQIGQGGEGGLDLTAQIQKEVDAEMRRKDAARKRMGELEQKAKIIGRKRG